MSESSSAASGGIGIAGLLGVVFVVLKLCHVINWSWWWVLAPFWIGPVILLAIAGTGRIVWGVTALLSRR